MSPKRPSRMIEIVPRLIDFNLKQIVSDSIAMGCQEKLSIVLFVIRLDEFSTTCIEPRFVLI